MKTKLLALLIAIVFGLTPTTVKADSGIIEEISNQNGYSWGMSDDEQITQMKGMILWGFCIAIASAILTIVIPHSISPTTTTGAAKPQGTSLF